LRGLRFDSTWPRRGGAGLREEVRQRGFAVGEGAVVAGRVGALRHRFALAAKPDPFGAGLGTLLPARLRPSGECPRTQ
jgi:hypothetical protein